MRNTIKYIEHRISHYSGGDEMKSMRESATDEAIVKELELIITEIKSTIHDNL